MEEGLGHSAQAGDVVVKSYRTGAIKCWYGVPAHMT